MNTTEKTPLDVNSTSKDSLTQINGIGPSLAQKIIDGRPYAQLDDLINVSGISQAKLEKLLPFLTLSKPQSDIITKKKALPAGEPDSEKPFTKIGETEAFVFFEDENQAHDALLIVLAGFILGLLILILRPSE